MSQSELWSYVLQHRSDNEAFYKLMDRVGSVPGTPVRSMEHLAELIETKQKAREQQAD
ncbi:MAG: hypothetical protein KME11_09980 [Timaviella obliquedivisa GSE-PSE-MK23-08B]|nr:hypothetical protein [Timaviella obliquedivisa GSE-PSE-MK23-08B]